MRKHFRISEPVSGQRSAADIFKKSKALNISLFIVISLESIFFTDFQKKKEYEIVLYKAVIYQKITSLIWSVQRSHMYARLWHTLKIMRPSTSICRAIYFDSNMFAIDYICSLS